MVKLGTWFEGLFELLFNCENVFQLHKAIYVIVTTDLIYLPYIYALQIQFNAYGYECWLVPDSNIFKNLKNHFD